MIDMNADLKNDTDEESSKFIMVTNKEEARKAMISKRFGGNTNGTAIGGNGTQRRKSKAVHKSGEDDIQMIEDIDSGMNTIDKASKQLPERSHAPRPTSIRPDFSVPGYRMFNAKSSNEKPQSTGLNYNLTRPIENIRRISDDPTPSAKMNSEFQERMRRSYNHDEGDEDDEEEDDEEEEEEGVSDMRDRSMDIDNRRTSISLSGKAKEKVATKCCEDPYQRKRKFSDKSEIQQHSVGSSLEYSNLPDLRPVMNIFSYDWPVRQQHQRKIFNDLIDIEAQIKLAEAKNKLFQVQMVGIIEQREMEGELERMSKKKEADAKIHDQELQNRLSSLQRMANLEALESKAQEQEFLFRWTQNDLKMKHLKQLEMDHNYAKAQLDSDLRKLQTDHENEVRAINHSNTLNKAINDANNMKIENLMVRKTIKEDIQKQAALIKLLERI